MSEQPKVPEQPDAGEQPRPAGSGTDAAEHGPVRTAGETTVDDAIGTGDNVH